MEEITLPEFGSVEFQVNAEINFSCSMNTHFRCINFKHIGYFIDLNNLYANSPSTNQEIPDFCGT
jgi:hypothetical protein